MGYFHLPILILYACFLGFIFVYSLTQFALVINYKRSKKIRGRTGQDHELTRFPKVTIQLPVFNEKYVVERLIDSCIDIDYPTDQLEIQVLDDSTDETLELSKEKVEYYSNLGYDIKLIRREDRKGFKAGALVYGTEICNGDFIAIFDADFIPDRGFLKRTIPFFADSQIGVVQSKWGHLNEHYSLLTELQAFGLNAHFSVEQTGRSFGGHFINFNGTGGIWRKETILDSGGWSDDTLTEDLDLSYRAQLKGWKFSYLEDLVSPAELPASINALKAQQYRWTKGAAECAKKNLFKVLSSGVKFSTKVVGTFHLMNSFIFLCIMGLTLLSVPVLYIKSWHPEYKLLYNASGMFLMSLVVLIYFYWTSAKNNNMTFLHFIGKFLMFLSVSMGLSLHNARAVLEGYLGIKSDFIRTPKFNLIRNSDQWNTKKYLKSNIKPGVFIELVLFFYACYGIYSGIVLKDFTLVPFHILLAMGFGFVSFYSIQHVLILKRTEEHDKVHRKVLKAA